KKEKNSIVAVQTLIRKSKVLLLLKKKEEVLSVSATLDEVVAKFPDLPERTEARILRAKILYDFNRFRESLNILSELKTANSESIYQSPEISLYFGYNYYQLGDNASARENLFRFYNSCPDQETNHLILTQIGDTYQNEGLNTNAARFYQMVLERYPDTEGAVISKIRLAEQQEEGLKQERSIVPAVSVIGEKFALANEIYEEIIKNPVNKQKRKTLTQLALLKLSILDQKEKEYQKSFIDLKTLFNEYPLGSLKNEWKKALFRAIEGIFEEAVKNKNYIHVVNFYLNEKELFSIVKAPELFVTVARAFMSLNIEDMGVRMFEEAEPLLSDQEKPPDLLFVLGKNFFEKDNFKDALKRFDLLIDKHPSDKYAPHASRLKGSIFLKQKRYVMAAEMFSATLSYPVAECEKLKVLIDKARALAADKRIPSAVEALTAAVDIKKNCDSTDYHVDQEIGDIYLDLGYIQNAVNIFKQAVEVASEKADKISMMLKIAQCYTRLNQKKEFLALYDQISNINDSFWSNLAKEKMDGIQFEWEIERKKLDWEIGENI
ncbi:MAG: tetratricopeptide repeat protein, partial [Proteobacteria bacterium]|nr:tetratricopeptide repeat protein [Pseudomonadota bacterium]